MWRDANWPAVLWELLSGSSFVQHVGVCYNVCIGMGTFP